jgi:hypothetical protein
MNVWHEILEEAKPILAIAILFGLAVGIGLFFYFI